MLRVCESCGTGFEQSGKGRPRRWCRECSPSVGEAGRAAAAAAWRELNPDAVQAFNVSRQKPRHGYLTCSECGRDFHNPRLMPGGRRAGHDPKTCSDACARKRRTRVRTVRSSATVR